MGLHEHVALHAAFAKGNAKHLSAQQKNADRAEHLDSSCFNKKHELPEWDPVILYSRKFIDLQLLVGRFSMLTHCESPSASQDKTLTSFDLFYEVGGSLG